MKNFLIIFWILFAVCLQEVYANDAPSTTAVTATASGLTAVVPITATNFSNIGSCGLELHFDPAIATATLVTTGPGLGGGFNTNLTVPGVIIIGWYTYPGVTMPANSIIFNITFSRVTSGTTAITWYDNGYSCYYSDGPGNILYDLPTSSFYFNGSLTFLSSLFADFTADNATPPKNTTVNFNDLTTGNPTSWSWSFNRSSVVYMNGTNSNSQNPKVQFTDGGLYTVTLVVHKTGNNDTKIKADYIRAGTHGQWTGATSSDWSTTTNWDDWFVPAASADLVISQSALFWPVITGDYSLGTDCNSLTLDGSAQFTVDGDFSINSGSGLNFTGNGMLHVGGNWTNAGNFNAGDGTVDFTGTNPASIISAGSPTVTNNFNNIKISKVGATLTNPCNIIVNGNLVINP